MTSLAPSNVARLCKLRSSKKASCKLAPHSLIRIIAPIGALLLALSPHNLVAQVGNENASGPAGIFNGNLENTGVDPWTGNGIRSITDISVAGALGEYPLALVRTANSRSPSTTGVFSWSGGWNHNYNWILEDSPNGNAQNFQPPSYTVDFPDGRVETFKSVNWDATCYRVRVINGAASSSAGVRERLVPINPPNNMYAYLILPDGGKVKFLATQRSVNGHWYYRYKATAIIDPYGLETTFQYAVVNNRRRLTQVTEPGGRYLQFSYIGNGPKISQVTASDGRSVNYYYTCCNNLALERVRYYNNAAWDAHYQYTNSNIGDPDNNPLLLKTCDDPMSGPMKRISYEYKTGTNADGNRAVYGQVWKVRYWNGTQGQEYSGPVVSTLTVGESNPVNHVKRKETRGDGAERTFIYNGAGQGYLAWASDFSDRYASQTYDQTTKYISAVMDRRGNTTDYTVNRLTGNVTQVQFPPAADVTPSPAPRGTVSYTYGWASCHDPNNRDANNPYFLCTTTDERGHVTKFWRDANKRVTKIEYPDGGYEQFTYNGFGQVLTHRLKTGGTETFAYDGLYRLQYYSDAYHNNANNASIAYFYEGHGWVNEIRNTLWQPTNWTYNDRGQALVTTLPPDPFDNNTRHTITNVYNPDGTLQSRTNELGFVTSYTYDDYRRLKSVTPPNRGDGTGTNTTSFYYGASAADNVNDYKLTDVNATWVVLPSGKKTKTLYDDNRLKSSVTIGYGSGDDATTSYGHDAAGNLTTIANPYNHNNTTIDYDTRNRPSAIHVLSQVTSFLYDTAGRKKKITHPNGQTVTYDTFDAMDRVTQQTATQNPTQAAVTRYEYYTTADGATAPVGLLKKMKDPRNTTDPYIYEYDLMGRKTKITYPLDTANAHRTEQWSYDDAGRLETFKNRAGKTQTFVYDPLNRINWLSWDDGGITPTVHFMYDAASRLTNIDNGNATIERLYWNDNLLGAETEQITNQSAKAVVYFYDDDGNRSQIYYPDAELTFTYTYTGRNQLRAIAPWATYEYDARGNLTTRTLYNGTHTDYPFYDAYDRAAWVVHNLNGMTPEFNYGYDDLSNNRKWVRRIEPGLGDLGDVFKYDLADQAIGFQLNVSQPQNVQSIPQNVTYDANGNRTAFGPDTYTINNNGLNQYSKRNNITASYDSNGSPTESFDGSDYTYDAQNRLTHAAKGSDTIDCAYDGLNRQVKRTVNGTTTYSVWDGWDLIEEYQAGGTPTAYYLHGPDGLILDSQVGNADINWYYHDGSGSTSHIADSYGNLKEWYRYDLQGTPIIYAPDNTTRTASALKVRHLFTGQQWYKEIGLYDLRNRFYSPDIGRFLQPDPIGFGGDRTNLYRYCGNNPVTRWDPFGLQSIHTPPPNPDQDIPWAQPVTVYGGPIIRELMGFPSFGDPGGSPFGGFGPREHPEFHIEAEFVYFKDDNPKSQPPPGPPQSAPPPQNPPPPAALSSGGAPGPSAPAAGVFALPSTFTQFTINVAIPLPRMGTLFGAQFSYATTPFGQRFYAVGPQVGKALTGVSLSYTVNNPTSRSGTGPAALSQLLTGGSWNAGGGYYGGGGQWTWATWRPWQATSWGGGFFTTQVGFGWTYGWEGATPTPSPGGY